MSKLALIIVDLQREFIGQNQDYISKVKDLAESWPNDQVYWMRYLNHPDSMFVRYLDWVEAIETPETSLIKWDGIEHTHIIDHYGYGIPQDELTVFKAKNRGAVICGADTDACVMSTMFNLWDNDIKPTLLSDYCLSSGGKEYHELALKLMTRQFGPRCILSGKKTYKDFV